MVTEPEEYLRKVSAYQESENTYMAPLKNTLTEDENKEEPLLTAESHPDFDAEEVTPTSPKVTRSKTLTLIQRLTSIGDGMNIFGKKSDEKDVDLSPRDVVLNRGEEHKDEQALKTYQKGLLMKHGRRSEQVKRGVFMKAFQEMENTNQVTSPFQQNMKQALSPMSNYSNGNISQHQRFSYYGPAAEVVRLKDHFINKQTAIFQE